MKWYFASRTRHAAALIAVSKFLESKGEIIVSDWIYHGSFAPYTDRLEEAHEINRHITERVLQADVFVMISDPAGTDMFVELGIALAKHTNSKGNRVYAVGEYAKRSLMLLHPAITHVEKLSDVFDTEGITYDNNELPNF